MPKKHRTIRTKINDKPFQVRFNSRMKNYGECHVITSEDGRQRRAIVLRPQQTDEQLLDTLIHEALHGYFWEILCEEAVSKSANDITALILKVFDIAKKQEGSSKP